MAAFYAELLQRGRGLGAPTASLVGRPLPSVVVPSTLIQAAAAAASLHSQSSRHPLVPAVSDDIVDEEASTTFNPASSPTVSDSAATLRKSLSSADCKRYHPYEKNAWLWLARNRILGATAVYINYYVKNMCPSLTQSGHLEITWSTANFSRSINHFICSSISAQIQL